MTRVLLDGRKIGDGGIGVYLENLIDGLRYLSAAGIIDLQLSLLVGHPPEKIAVSRSSACGRLRECLRRWRDDVRLVYEPSGKYSLREYLTLARRQKGELASHDIFHSPHYTLPYFLEIPAVVTVHDVIHVTHPQTFYHRPVGRRLICSALARANHVITVSEESKLQIEELVGGETEVPISVVHNALRIGIARREPEQVGDTLRREFFGDNYCLFVGSDRPHKGFPQLLEVWANLKREAAARGQECPELLLVGRAYSLASQQEVEAAGLQGVFRFLGEVSVDKLCFLYAGAKAVLIPSRVEGFGLPALEAMACEAPVVCTPIPSLLEVCGEAGQFAVDMTPEAFTTALCEVLYDQDWANTLRKRGAVRAQDFSLERQALRTWNIYQSTLGREPLPLEILADFEMPKESVTGTLSGYSDQAVRTSSL